GAYGLLGVVLMRSRVAEIHEHAVPAVLSDIPVKPPHRIGDLFLEGGDQIVDVLGVEPRRNRSFADHIANHDRELALLKTNRADFASGRWLSAGRRCGFHALTDGWRYRRRLRAAKVGNERRGDRIGLCVQLALEQPNEVLIVLERFGLASRGGQSLDDQPM